MEARGAGTFCVLRTAHTTAPTTKTSPAPKLPLGPSTYLNMKDKEQHRDPFNF